MKVRRTIQIDADAFSVGDVFSFEMKGGRRAKATAAKKASRGMLFIMMDSFIMIDSSGAARFESAEKILNRFPSKLRERMIAFKDGSFLRFYDGFRPMFLLPVEIW